MNENDDDNCKLYRGPYEHLRKQMDYSYHSNYVPQRQAFQDDIISRTLQQHASPPPPNTTTTKDVSIVFTAG